MNIFSLSHNIRWILFSIMIIFLAQLYLSYTNKDSILVFCDVGQGDGTYIRLRNKYDILIDAGPNDQILSCLGKYMPFYDKTIELAFLSHPQKDHFGGFDYVRERYHLNTFVTTQADVKNTRYDNLIQNLKNAQTDITYLYSGDQINLTDAVFKFLSPTQDFILNTHPVRDPNDASEVILMQSSFTSVLFTGDSTPEVLNNIVKKYQFKVSILKVPHHGSRNGLIEELLTLANPSIAVISVGKNNSYGHPAKRILDLLANHHIFIARTDQRGDIVFRY